VARLRQKYAWPASPPKIAPRNDGNKQTKYLHEIAKSIFEFIIQYGSEALSGAHCGDGMLLAEYPFVSVSRSIPEGGILSSP
jgi:hypothetical protein